MLIVVDYWRMKFVYRYIYAYRLTHLQNDPELAKIVRTVPVGKRRFEAVHAYCTKISICKPDEPNENGEDAPPSQPGHGGCGRLQPAIRREALKLFSVNKQQKHDEEASIQ